MRGNWVSRFTLLCGVAAAMAASAQGPVFDPPGKDYLTPDLRERVQHLKATVGEPASGRAEIEDRARTLWEWGNTFVRAGGPIHPTLPLAVSQVLENNPPGALIFLRQLPMLVHDLTVKEEAPGALGTVDAAPLGPFEANGFVTMRQTYTVGDWPIQEGGVLFLGREFSSDHGDYQANDPQDENYVTISSSNPDARFSLTAADIFGPHGGFVVAAPVLGFKLEGTALEKGETITIVYGDTTQGSPGFRVNTFEGDGFLLPIYADLAGDGMFLRPEWPSYSIHGRAARAVQIFAPSVAATGDTFEVTVRTEDEFINPAHGAIPGYTLTRGGADVATVPAGTNPLHTVRLTIDTPGVYWLDAKSTTGAITGRSNPIWVQDAPAFGIFWGDTHGHIQYSEGVGTIEHFFEHARDHARLDYVSLTEHDVFMDDVEWNSLVEATQHYFDEGRFITYLGYEWTANIRTGGHHNVLYRTPSGRQRTPMQETESLEALYEGLRAANDINDVVTIPHAHAPGDWTRSDPDLERLVEITSMHGTFEWFGNNYLQQGFLIGFVGASDDHRARPGYTGVTQAVTQQYGGLGAVLAAQKSKESIFDAMRDRTTYATTGQRMVMNVTLGDTLMGGFIDAGGHAAIGGWVAGTMPVDRLDVVKNGEIVWTRKFLIGPLESECSLLIAYESSSDPMEHEVPRGTRSWSGTATITGAKVENVDAPGFENYYYEMVQQREQEPNTVDFYSRTRGQADTMVIGLSEVAADGQLRLAFEVAEEGGRILTAQPRAAERFPAFVLEVPFAELADGAVVRDVSVGPNKDTVRIQVLPKEMAYQQDLEFRDEQPAEPGDYYYVRALQLDGGMAWTSPWFVR